MEHLDPHNAPHDNRRGSTNTSGLIDEDAQAQTAARKSRSSSTSLPGWVNMKACDPFEEQRKLRNSNSAGEDQVAEGGANGSSNPQTNGANGAGEVPSKRKSTPKLKSLWNKVKSRVKDQWEDFSVTGVVTEKAVRHTYHANENCWRKDWVLVKVEKEPFASGAMRNCYRMKKLSNFLTNSSWHNASNLVAKRYKIATSHRPHSGPSSGKNSRSVSEYSMTDSEMRVAESAAKGYMNDSDFVNEFENIEDFPEEKDEMLEVYRIDVEMQMISKQYGEYYNVAKTFPDRLEGEEQHLSAVPKKVDFMMAYLIEMVDRPGAPIYCVERFMDGDYRKYNTNSGHLPQHKHADGSLEHCRLTPQAFSHFTYVRSKGRLLVCDIQGVGDLYTDPQIHTINGEGLGEGNLGAVGISLFFNTHKCNGICRLLGLESFPVYPCKYSADTQTSNANGEETGQKNIREENSGKEKKKAAIRRMLTDKSLEVEASEKTLNVDERIGANESVNTLFKKMEGLALNDQALVELNIPEVQKIIDGEGIPLECTMDGNVHYQLAQCHLTGRFLKTTELGEQCLYVEERRAAALFHLHKAAVEGHIRSQISLARIYSDLPTILTEGIQHQLKEKMEDSIHTLEKKLDEKNVKRRPSRALIKLAAERGARGCIAKLGDDYFEGAEGERNWKLASEYYLKFVSTFEDGNDQNKDEARQENDIVIGQASSFEDDFDGPQLYEVYAKLGEIFMNGDDTIEQDTDLGYEYYNSAAEMAMSVGKGKLANVYFMKAEGC
eukprot:Nk52_evm14s355 gene=Nk52_evmTU14s355